MLAGVFVLFLMFKEMLSKYLLPVGFFGPAVYQVEVFQSLPSVHRVFGLIANGYSILSTAFVHHLGKLWLFSFAN